MIATCNILVFLYTQLRNLVTIVSYGIFFTSLSQFMDGLFRDTLLSEVTQRTGRY